MEPGTSAWVNDSVAEYIDSTHCHLDRMNLAPGTPEEAVTEFAYHYDPNGNPVAITYPNDIVAAYGFDFADRQSSLAAACFILGGAVEPASGDGCSSEEGLGAGPSCARERHFWCGEVSCGRVGARYPG